MDRLLSKQVHDMRKRGDDAISVFQEYGIEIVAAMQEAIDKALTKDGDGVVVVTQHPTEKPPTTDLPNYIALKNLADLLGYRLELLKQADLEVHREKKETQSALTKRDNMLLNIRDQLIRLRFTMDGIYGSTFSDSIGLSGDTPYNPKVIEQAAHSVANIVSKKDFTLPAPLNAEMPSWTVDQLQTYLTKIVAPLEEIIKEVSRESKEDQAAQIRRRAQLESTRQAMTAFTSTLETWARLALLPEIADRIRPVNRSTTTTQEDGDPTSANPPDSSANPPDSSTTTQTTPATSTTP